MTPHTTHCKECAQHAADDQPLPVTVVQEDVLYALSQSDSMQDMGVEDLSQLTPDSRSKMLYLMNDEGGSTSTLAYLRSVYNTPGHARTQWANFVERVKDLAVAQGLKDVPKTVEEVRLCCAGYHVKAQHMGAIWGVLPLAVVGIVTSIIQSNNASTAKAAQHDLQQFSCCSTWMQPWLRLWTVVPFLDQAWTGATTHLHVAESLAACLCSTTSCLVGPFTP